MVRICTVQSPYEPEKREREARVLREEQEAPGQRSPGSSGVQRGLQERERDFVRRTSGEREFGVQGLRVRSPLVKFFFIVKFACPVEASPFVADPCILIVFFFCFVSSFFLLHRVVLKESWEVVSWPDIYPTSGIRARRYKDADCSGGEQD